jgi:DNA-binding transcriptional LysR family regulator
MDRIDSARVFLAIAERGSLAAAAQHLDMSRAMVTRYLAEMEAWAGARLLHRTTRRLSLTVAGELTVTRCRTLLELADAMAGAADADPSAPHGLLRIACAQFLAQTALAEALPDFLRRFPRTSVDLQVDNRTVNLVEERIDLAIRITNALEPNLIARRLADCASLVCAAPSYLAAHGTPQAPPELARHNCLTYSYFGNSVWQFEPGPGQGTPLAVPVQGNLSSNESMALLAAAERGAGIALQPRAVALPLVRAGRLVQLLPAWHPPALGIYGIYSSRQHLPAVLRAMLDFLVAWFAHDPRWLENA